MSFRLMCRRNVCSVISLFFICTAGLAAQSLIPQDRISLWEENASYCTAPDGTRFPSKGGCDDGDMTLFNGLLCGAGDDRGCRAVKASQDPSGRWWRSPRRAQNNNLSPDGKTRQRGSFSPDMALGTDIYATITSDSVSFRKWLGWIEDHRPCLIGDGDSCFKGYPRFCDDDSPDSGCSLKPGDLADLSSVSAALNASVPGTILPSLFNDASGHALQIIWLNSQVNDPGYSQHLVAVEIFLHRTILRNPDPLLLAAAKALHNKQPQNPFFSYLADEPHAEIANKVLNLCPTKKSDISTDLDQWSWERADSEAAWKHSMLWDCLFMARLLNK